MTGPVQSMAINSSEVTGKEERLVVGVKE